MSRPAKKPSATGSRSPKAGRATTSGASSKGTVKTKGALDPTGPPKYRSAVRSKTTGRAAPATGRVTDTSFTPRRRSAPGPIMDDGYERVAVQGPEGGAAGAERYRSSPALRTGLTLHEVQSVEELLRGIAQSSAAMAERGIELIERESDEFTEVGTAIANGLRQLFPDGFPDAGFDIADAVQSLAAPRLWEQRVGELLSPTEYSGVVGKSRQAVQQQITTGTLLAGRDRNGRWRIPKWQIGLSAEARRALVRATQVLVEEGGLDPWSALAWVADPHPEAAGAKPRLLVADPDGAERVLELAMRDAHAASR